MKKLMTIAALFTSLVSFASCEKMEIITVADLPAKSQTFLKTHFDGVGVVSVVKEIDGLEKDYKVILENGFSLDFTRSGDWDEVDGRNTVLPDSVLALLPAGIESTVNQFYPDHFIVKVSRDRTGLDKGYDVKLNGDIELEFNDSGVLVELDD